MILFVWVFFLTLCSIVFLMKSKDYTGISDYKSLARLCFDRWGAFITDFCILVNNLGLCIGYLIIYADCLHEFLSKGFDFTQDDFWGKRWLHIIAGATLITPFLYARSTKLLSIASGLSVFSIMMFLIITGVDFKNSVTVESLEKIDILPDFSKLELTEAIIAFPALFVAFTFHYNFYPVLQSLKDPTTPRMLKAG